MFKGIFDERDTEKIGKMSEGMSFPALFPSPMDY
jgi:hypothetical protein